MTQLKPFYDQMQSIYDHDHTTDLLELFLDPTLLYSCAHFERDDMTLEEAQLAKLDLALDKCDLHPGQLLLEIGCGWGACSYRAADKYGVNVIGLTLSESQVEYCNEKMKGLRDGAGTVEIRLQSWEEFNEPVDRIISIGAFEHFRYERYAQFFRRCFSCLPDDGRMLLHCIVRYDLETLKSKGIEVTHENVLFSKFIGKEIFPRGQLADPKSIIRLAETAGFKLERAQSLQAHYARTLDIWAHNLEANRDEAVKRKSQAVYDRYMKYLTGCADHFRSGHIDVYQFTLCKP